MVGNADHLCQLNVKSSISIPSDDEPLDPP